MDLGKLLKMKLEKDKFNPDLVVNLKPRNSAGFGIHDTLRGQTVTRILTSTDPQNFKEKSMSGNIAASLLAMAGASDNLEAEYGAGLPENIKEVLKEKMEKERKAQAEAAADHVLKVFKQSKHDKDHLIDELRQLRRREKAIKTQLENLNRAEKYGAETGNYLPLGELTRVVDTWDVPSENRDKFKIPDDWKPNEAPAAETTA